MDAFKPVANCPWWPTQAYARLHLDPLPSRRGIRQDQVMSKRQIILSIPPRSPGPWEYTNIFSWPEPHRSPSRGQSSTLGPQQIMLSYWINCPQYGKQMSVLSTWDHRASLAVGGSSTQVYCVSRLAGALLAWKALAEVWEAYLSVNSTPPPSHDHSFLNECFSAEAMNMSLGLAHVHNREAMWVAVSKPHRISQKPTTFVVSPVPGPNFMAQKTCVVKFQRKQRMDRSSLKRQHTSLFQSERVKDENHRACGCLLLLSWEQSVAGPEQLP